MSNDKKINVSEIDISGGDTSAEAVSEELAKELSPEQLAHRERMMKLMFSKFTNSSSNWKMRLKGFPNHGKVKQYKFWHNGNLISKAEHDKLPIEEILEYNNKITRGE